MQKNNIYTYIHINENIPKTSWWDIKSKLSQVINMQTTVSITRKLLVASENFPLKVWKRKTQLHIFFHKYLHMETSQRGGRAKCVRNHISKSPRICYVCGGGLKTPLPHKVYYIAFLLCTSSLPFVLCKQATNQKKRWKNCKEKSLPKVLLSTYSLNNCVHSVTYIRKHMCLLMHAVEYVLIGVRLVILEKLYKQTSKQKMPLFQMLKRHGIVSLSLSQFLCVQLIERRKTKCLTMKNKKKWRKLFMFTHEYRECAEEVTLINRKKRIR